MKNVWMSMNWRVCSMYGTNTKMKDLKFYTIQINGWSIFLITMKFTDNFLNSLSYISRYINSYANGITYQKWQNIRIYLAENTHRKKKLQLIRANCHHNYGKYSYTLSSSFNLLVVCNTSIQLQHNQI